MDKAKRPVMKPTVVNSSTTRKKLNYVFKRLTICCVECWR